LFERDWDGDRSRVLDIPNANADVQWVFDGEGTATRKYDGTCVMFDGTDWWARREVKAGKEAPAGFMPVEHDHVTGAATGWQPIADSPFAKFHAEALAHDRSGNWPWHTGTYELVGPKIQGNPEKFEVHALVEHALATPITVLRTFDAIRDTIERKEWEGIVFHSTDKGMVKIKGRDFGLRRG
jgi:hypothetical protein